MSPLPKVAATTCLLALVSVQAWAGLGRPIPVSPGSADDATALAAACPSFSWTAVAKARAYELVVHRIEAEPSERADVSRTSPRYLSVGRAVLRARIPGPALSWTPSLDRCLEPGASYAWLVRARWAGRAGRWSEPGLFRVTSETGPVALRAESGTPSTPIETRGTSGPAPPAAASGAGLETPGSEGETTTAVLGPVPATPQPALKAFFAEHAATDSNHGGVVGVAWGQDSGLGVYGENAGRGNYGYLGGPAYGVEGRGNAAGGYFKDTTASGEARVGFSNRGIEASGSEYGAYGENSDSSNWGYLGGSSYGVEGRGNAAGGYFKDTTASGQAKVGFSNRGIDASGDEYGARFSSPADGTVLRLVGGSEVSLAGGGAMEIGTGPFRLSADSDEIQSFRTDGTGQNLHLNPHGGRIGIGTSTALNTLDVRGPGSNEGGVAQDDVVARFLQTDTSQHSAIAIDSADLGTEADPGQDPALHFAKGGSSLWSIRVDDGDSKAEIPGVPDPDTLEIRWHGGDPSMTALHFEPQSDEVDALFYGDVLPGPDGVLWLGNSYHKWEWVFAVNPLIQTSDRRLKTDVQPLSRGLEAILGLRPVSYAWKDSTDDRTHLGLIAQEVEPLIPEAVRRGKNDEDPWSMTYSSLIPVLVKAIQEQQIEIDRLRADLERLHRQEVALR